MSEGRFSSYHWKTFEFRLHYFLQGENYHGEKLRVINDRQLASEGCIHCKLKTISYKFKEFPTPGGNSTSTHNSKVYFYSKNKK